MAGIKFSREEVEKITGKITKSVEEKISLLGTHLESINEQEIELEILPNRPDLFSLHGFANALASFLGKKISRVPKINRPKKNYEVIIDKSALNIRPYTACAIVKNLKFDDKKIKEIIDVQEKIHATLGRNRKKIAIGIYPLEKIILPIKLEARDPEEIKFQPLEADREMNGMQILREHPTGRDYAHLLEGMEKFPIFVDAAGEILSMPPIINSHKTGKVTEATKDIFIECSGFNLEILEKTINILAKMFADMHGEVYAMNIKHPKGNYITPDFTPEKIKISLDNVNKMLGLNLKEAEMKKLLEKMGYKYKKGFVLAPSWRTDIIHEVDIIEDIAIAYGYNNFIPYIPNISFAGQESDIEIKKRKIAEILTGLNMLEISSYHLTTSEDQYKKTGIKPEEIIEIENSKTEYNILRRDLMHYALKTLGHNVDASYPQSIFEIGKVFAKDEKEEVGIKETERLCIALAGQTANFTEIKQAFDYLARMLGKDYKIASGKNPYFIDGRCGEIILNGKKIGYLGEISLQILANLKIKMPVSALEIDIHELL